MKLKLNTKKLAKQLNEVNKIKFDVGVDASLRAEQADYSSQDRVLGSEFGSVMVNPIKRGGGHKPLLSDILGKLNGNNPWLLEAFDELGDDDINDVINALIEGKKGYMKVIEEILLDAFKEPMIKGELGSNDSDTIEAKGFNLVGINTGTLFNAIEVKGRKGRE